MFIDIGFVVPVDCCEEKIRWTVFHAVWRFEAKLQLPAALCLSQEGAVPSVQFYDSS
jgi:hypothetical protein